MSHGPHRNGATPGATRPHEDARTPDTPSRETTQSALRELLRKSPLLLFILVTVVVFVALRPGFLSIRGFLDIGQQIAVTAVIAFAMTAVIVGRGIDISVGSTVAVSGIVGAQLLSVGLPGPLAIVATVLVGAAIGTVNGVLVGFLGVSPLMATLGTLAFGRGAALALSGASSIPVENTTMILAGGSYVGPVPTSVVIALICMAAWMFLLGGTVYGRWVYAVGGNKAAAHASLVPARLVSMSTYMLVGAAAGLGAVITIGRVKSAQPLAGMGLEFAAITAVIVGGTKLSGGVGTIWGTALGAVLVGVINSGLLFLQVPQQAIYVVTGSLVILAVLVTQRRELADLAHRVRTNSVELHRRRKARAYFNEERQELRVEEIGKNYPGVQALDSVTFALHAGEVVALTGENGAGKSTLVKILAGVEEPDTGTITLDGAPLRLRSAEESQAAGISVIHQHFSLVPDLTVTENLFLGRELTIPVLGGLRRQKMRSEARRIIDDLELPVDIDAPVAGLPVGQRQMVEVAKAMHSNAWLVIMDEPTSALSNRERDLLYNLVHRLLARDVAVLYISHKMEEIFTLANRVVVLRDGQFVNESPITALDHSSLIAMMVGRQVDNVFAHADTSPGDVLLEIDGVSDGNLLQEVSLTVRAGEVVALAGLMGSGRSEVLRCASGLSRYVKGSVRVIGKELPSGRMTAANRRGVAYVPEDRHHEGVVPAMSVQDNIILAWLRRHARRVHVPAREAAVVTGEQISQLSVRPPAPNQQVDLLSGGNQQKVVLGRWLATEPRVLLLDEPTRGVDVGSKAEIHELIAELKRQGIAVLMVSSELPEVIGVADRIVVMHDGYSVGELPRGATEEQVMELAFGRRGSSRSVGAEDRRTPAGVARTETTFREDQGGTSS